MATDSDTRRIQESSPQQRTFFAGMEEIEDELEAEWRMKEKAEFGLLEEVGGSEDATPARSQQSREDRMAEEFWLNNGKFPTQDQCAGSEEESDVEEEGDQNILREGYRSELKAEPPMNEGDKTYAPLTGST
ncbi:hypothetical protein B0H14DRAFT_2599464 [Mycena olivaceomarginata]|nr:hypothetical protein B0H14DRAFT_2599464 [Mycena olivaceomarginata]